jgi:ribosomal protein S18 acetylase RimI-like enzyme
MLRTVTEQDIDAIMQIVVAAGLFERSDREFLAGAVREFASTHSESGAGFLLDIDGDQAVGVVSWNPKVAADAVWDLTMIAVLPDRQGSGRGAAMMAHVENELALAGQRLLLVETSSTAQYDGTRAFYRRCGYDEEARVRDYWSDGDDLVLFRKRISVVT